MNKNSIITVLMSVVLSIISCFIIVLWKAPKKQAYIENYKVYESFKAKKELEAQLLNLKSANKMRLDSIRLLVKDEQTELYYRQQALQIEQEEEEAALKYNTQIWNQLNSYVQEYGKANSYDFIQGATGSGSMMYAREDLDITDEIIEYVNKKYEDQ